jgi:hypothetical protein
MCRAAPAKSRLSNSIVAVFTCARQTSSTSFAAAAIRSASSRFLGPSGLRSRHWLTPRLLRAWARIDGWATCRASATAVVPIAIADSLRLASISS